MPQTIQSLATLIGSRICHDLISPVGAIQNGIELLAMEGRSGPEISLIEDSAQNASARIRFLRVAFGLAGAGQVMGRSEIDSILGDYGRSSRVKFEWADGDECPRATTQEVFLAFLCLESAMPRGGTVTVTEASGTWSISAAAQRDRVDTRLWQILCGADQSNAAILPAHVQFLMLPLLLNERGVRAEVVNQQDHVTIRFPG